MAMGRYHRPYVSTILDETVVPSERPRKPVLSQKLSLWQLV
jgi:hypothetical protein